MVYLEQMYTKLLNLADNRYNITMDTTSFISKWHKFSQFLSLVILFSVLPNNFIVSGVKSGK